MRNPLRTEVQACSARRRLSYSLRRGLVYAVSRTFQDDLERVVEDVFAFAHERFFKGETVQAVYGTLWMQAKIVDIRGPSENDLNDLFDECNDIEFWRGVGSGRGCSSSSKRIAAVFPPAKSYQYLVRFPESGYSVWREWNHVRRPEHSCKREVVGMFVRKVTERRDGIFVPTEDALRHFDLADLRESIDESVFCFPAPYIADVLLSPCSFPVPDDSHREGAADSALHDEVKPSTNGRHIHSSSIFDIGPSDDEEENSGIGISLAVPASYENDETNDRIFDVGIPIDSDPVHHAPASEVESSAESDLKTSTPDETRLGVAIAKDVYFSRHRDRERSVSARTSIVDAKPTTISVKKSEATEDDHARSALQKRRLEDKLKRVWNEELSKLSPKVTTNIRPSSPTQAAADQTAGDRGPSELPEGSLENENTCTSGTELKECWTSMDSPPVLELMKLASCRIENAAAEEREAVEDSDETVIASPPVPEPMESVGQLMELGSSRNRNVAAEDREVEELLDETPVTAPQVAGKAQDIRINDEAALEGSDKENSSDGMPAVPSRVSETVTKIGFVMSSAALPSEETRTASAPVVVRTSGSNNPTRPANVWKVLWKVDANAKTQELRRDEFSMGAMCTKGAKQVVNFFLDFADNVEAIRWFPEPVTLELVERAIRSERGRDELSDILTALLDILFVTWGRDRVKVDERREMISASVHIETLDQGENARAKLSLVSSIATQWPEFYLGQRIEGLTRDAVTLSEILRLLLLHCATRQIYLPSGLSAKDGPFFEYLMHSWGVVKDLGFKSVYELLPEQKMCVVNCLIGQIVSHPNFQKAVKSRKTVGRLITEKRKRSEREAARRKSNSKTPAGSKNYVIEPFVNPENESSTHMLFKRWRSSLKKRHAGTSEAMASCFANSLLKLEESLLSVRAGGWPACARSVLRARLVAISKGALSGGSDCQLTKSVISELGKFLVTLGRTVPKERLKAPLANTVEQLAPDDCWSGRSWEDDFYDLEQQKLGIPWESSAAAAKSFSSLFLHLDALGKSVDWTEDFGQDELANGRVMEKARQSAVLPKTEVNGKCFHCKKTGIFERNLVRCGVPDCGNLFHFDCTIPVLTALPRSTWVGPCCRDDHGYPQPAMSTVPAGPSGQKRGASPQRVPLAGPPKKGRFVSLKPGARRRAPVPVDLIIEGETDEEDNDDDDGDFSCDDSDGDADYQQGEEEEDDDCEDASVFAKQLEGRSVRGSGKVKKPPPARKTAAKTEPPKRHAPKKELGKPSAPAGPPLVRKTARMRKTILATSNEDIDVLVLEELWKLLTKHESSYPFHRAVTRQEAPYYFDIVKEPMDFGTIKGKMSLMKYSCNAEFLHDVQRIIDNAKLANVKGDSYYVLAENLEEYFLGLLPKYGLRWTPYHEE